MTRVRLFLCVLVLTLLGGGWLAGQDEKKPTAPVRGQLPANWRQLGLSKDQVRKIYTVQTEYRGKIADLQQQIAKLKTQERAELEKVLTPAQKERLREILAGKAPADGGKKEKKPGKP